jgi:hypothetical protein
MRVKDLSSLVAPRAQLRFAEIEDTLVIPNEVPRFFFPVLQRQDGTGARRREGSAFRSQLCSIQTPLEV